MAVTGDVLSGCYDKKSDGRLIDCKCTCRCAQVDPEADPAPLVACCIKAEFSGMAACSGLMVYGLTVSGLYAEGAYYEAQNTLNGEAIHLQNLGAAAELFNSSTGCFWRGVYKPAAPLFRSWAYNPTPGATVGEGGPPEGVENPELSQGDQCIIVDAGVVRLPEGYDPSNPFTPPGGAPATEGVAGDSLFWIVAYTYVTGKIYTNSAPTGIGQPAGTSVQFPVLLFSRCEVIPASDTLELGSDWTLDSDLTSDTDDDLLDPSTWVANCHGVVTSSGSGGYSRDHHHAGGLYGGSATLSLAAGVTPSQCAAKNAPSCGHSLPVCICDSPPELICLSFTVEHNGTEYPVHLLLTSHAYNGQTLWRRIALIDDELYVYVSLQCFHVSELPDGGAELPEGVSIEAGWVWLLSFSFKWLGEDSGYEAQLVAEGGQCPQDVIAWLATTSLSHNTIAVTIDALEEFDLTDTESPCIDRPPLTCDDLGENLVIAFREITAADGSDYAPGFVKNLTQTSTTPPTWEGSEFGTDVTLVCEDDHFTLTIDRGIANNYVYESDDGRTWTLTGGTNSAPTIVLAIDYLENRIEQDTDSAGFDCSNCSDSPTATVSGTESGTHDDVIDLVFNDGTNKTCVWDSTGMDPNIFRVFYVSGTGYWEARYRPLYPTNDPEYVWRAPNLATTHCPADVTRWYLCQTGDSQLPTMSLAA